MKLKSTLLINSFLCSSLFCMNSYAHELILTVDKIKKLNGVLMIALHDTENNYKSDTNVFAGKKIRITDKTLTVNFGDVPDGNYAIKLFQDENENGHIDKNFMGIPSEPYGFSNNGGAMSQPDFNDAKFTINADTTIVIHLR